MAFVYANSTHHHNLHHHPHHHHAQLQTVKNTSWTTNPTAQAYTNDFVSYFFSLGERSQRLLAFAAFFLALISTLFIMSKIYKLVYGLRARFKLYGFYMNPHCECFVLSLSEQMKYKKLALISNLNRKLSSSSSQQQQTKSSEIKMLEALRLDFRESGNLNVIFQMDDEEGEGNSGFSEETCGTSNSSLLTTETSSEISEVMRKKTKGNAVQTYIALKRQNRLAYKRFDRVATARKRKAREAVGENMQRFKKKLRQKLKRAGKKDFSLSETGARSLVNNSNHKSSVLASIELPTILITDTVSMSTIIVDLDSLEDYLF